VDPPSNYYDDVVEVYIRMIKRDSPAAAAAIEEIFASFGSRATLRATLVMTLLKMDAQKNHSVENINVQMHLIKDFPEAVPLLERAITCWIQAWNMPPDERPDLANGNPISADVEPAPSTPELPPA
jgi:hypothetical protein